MPRFSGLRRLSSISDYKPKREIKNLVIEDEDSESRNVGRKNSDNKNSESKNLDNKNSERKNSDKNFESKNLDNKNFESKNLDDRNIENQDFESEQVENFAVKQLREFILSHPKVTNPITDTLFLKRFLHHRKFNQEEAEGTIINYIKARRDHPLCYQNLNIDDTAVLELIRRGYIFPLMEKDSGGHTVIMFRNEAFSYYKYGNLGTDLFRAIVMTFEHLLCDEDNQKKGFVYIVDFKGSCLSEVMKVGVYETQKYVRSGVKSFPVRHASIHWINASAWMRSIFLMMASVVPEKIKKRIHIHSDQAEIFQFVDEKIIPHEYGGQGGPMEIMIKNYIDKLRERKPFLMALDDMSYTS